MILEHDGCHKHRWIRFCLSLVAKQDEKRLTYKSASIAYISYLLLPGKGILATFVMGTSYLAPPAVQQISTFVNCNTVDKIHTRAHFVRVYGLALTECGNHPMLFLLLLPSFK